MDPDLIEHYQSPDIHKRIARAIAGANDNLELFYILFDVAHIYWLRHQFNRALMYLDMAINLTWEIDNPPARVLPVLGIGPRDVEEGEWPADSCGRLRWNALLVRNCLYKVMQES